MSKKTKTLENRQLAVILALRNGYALIVQELNKVLGEMAPPGAGGPPAVSEDVPEIDLGELATAGWTSYKTKQPAEASEPAWIKNPAHFTTFEPPQVIYELVKALEASKGHRLQLGDMEYFYSGEKKFLSRRPAKQEKAR